MQKSPLCFLVVGLCVLFGWSVAYSNSCSAGMTHCTKHHYDFPPNLTENGCSQLNVTIYNNTAYSLTLDNSDSGSVNEGDMINSDPVTINPSKSNLITLQGVEVDTQKDEVNKTLRFIAYDAEGKKTGAQFTVQVTKNSCNAVMATCKQKDHPCYCTSTTSGGSCVDAPQACDKAWYNDPYSGASNYEPLHSQDHYWDPEEATNCDKSTQTDGLTASANFSDAKAIYIDSYTAHGAYFSCEKETVCDASADPQKNSPATISFNVNPSPIEKLTITFPFNSQSPFGKTMFGSIYNNLQAKYLSSLSTYYSVQPVVVSEASSAMTFSMLCNSATCPPPP